MAKLTDGTRFDSRSDWLWAHQKLENRKKWFRISTSGRLGVADKYRQILMCVDAAGAFGKQLRASWLITNIKPDANFIPLSLLMLSSCNEVCDKIGTSPTSSSSSSSAAPESSEAGPKVLRSINTPAKSDHSLQSTSPDFANCVCTCPEKTACSELLSTEPSPECVVFFSSATAAFAARRTDRSHGPTT